MRFNALKLFAILLCFSILFSVGCETSNLTTETETESQTEIQTEAPSNLGGELETNELGLEIDAVTADRFFRDSDPAASREEALSRAEIGEIAGSDIVPDQAPTISSYQPMIDGQYVKNADSYYIDNNTYVVVNAYGQEVLRVYRGGGYITLEEVAAYVYAFGEVPANHSNSKKTRPKNSIWAEHLRVNNTKFSGSTTKYPYEPELPRISGCGGDLQYWEMDIGTTGTDCDPGYRAQLYNDGNTITRGAARIVYTWNDLNRNGRTDATDLVFVFYTYNHYNDFQEYLNYFGGWGEKFGNVTGGGTLSSKTDYNPSPYVPVVVASLSEINDLALDRATSFVLYAIIPESITYFTSKKAA